MTITKTHDLNLCFLVIGADRIAGFGSGDAISISPAEDAQTVTVGVDGQPTVSRSNNRTREATITVASNSLANQRLSALYKAQLAQAPILPLNFSLFDLIDGTKVTSPYTIFTRRADVTRTKELGDSVWVLSLTDPTETDSPSVTQ